MAQNKTNQKSVAKDDMHYVKLMWKIFGGVLLFLVAFFFFLSIGWLGFMPSFEELENPNANQASEVYAADGELLGYIGVQNRSDVQYKDLPPHLVHALVATEDARFYEHSGVDMRSLFRGLGKTLIAGNRDSGGGSTLTQQLAKNLFPRDRKSRLGLVYSKLKEWVVAIKLERNYTKDEILTMYLNTVDFGSNAFGIKTAAKTFFDKEPSQLTMEEAATLVGLLKGPSLYSPVYNHDNSFARRNVVLAQINKYGYLTKETMVQDQSKPLDMSHYSPQSHDEGTATYFREYIRAYMKEWGKTHTKENGDPYNVERDGLKIYTTIDSRMQKYAEEAVLEHLGKSLQPQFVSSMRGVKDAPFTGMASADIHRMYLQAMKNSDRYQQMKEDGYSDNEIETEFHKKVGMRVFTWNGDRDTVMSPWDSLQYYKYFLNTGMISIEPQTGYVRVYVGGINFKYFKYDFATMGHRQVGSTFKPFVYASAMQDNNLSPCFQLPNIPVTFEDFKVNGKPWCPNNSNSRRNGEMITLKWALANSVNYISAKLIKDYTTPSAVVSLVHRMGIKSDIPNVPSICLGTCDLTVMEMAQAMATFANRGTHMEPVFITKITDNKGLVLDVAKQKSNQVLDEKTSYLVLDLMKGVVDGGTGGRLRYVYGVKSIVAGKTGTTDNNSDGWFIGINPRLATAVWVGGEVRSIHFRSTYLGQGASMALPIYGKFMEKCERDKNLHFYEGDFYKPADLQVEQCDKYIQELQGDRKPTESTTTVIQ